MAVIAEALAVDLTVAYMELLEQLGEAVGAVFREVFESFDHLERAQLAEFLDRAGPIGTAGAAEAVDLTAAYLAEVTGAPAGAVDLALELPALDGPFLHHWHELSQGQQWTDARDGGASQAEMLGADVTNAGASARMGQPGVKTRGYRRALSPGACDWCQVVSTQLYRSAESARFGHHNCHCRVIAVVGDYDAVKTINSQRLSELKRSGAVARSSTARTRARAR